MNNFLFLLILYIPGCSKPVAKQSHTKFGRLKTQYAVPLKNRGGNFGDCFQGFAVENIFREMGVSTSEIVLVNRDSLDKYEGEKVIVPMQGYFGYGTKLALSSKIIPVYVGFHLNINIRKLFARSLMFGEMKKSAHLVGCRDRETVGFLKSLNINSYFSGCLTLTFPRRDQDPKNGKVFIVDCPEEFKQKIPHSLIKDAVNTTNMYYFKTIPITDAEYFHFEREAKKQMEMYKSEAKLVITKRIHVAMPCIAMGIPVVFVTVKPSDCRFDVLRGIVKVNGLQDEIDWDPKVPDIESIKDLIKSNVIARIKEVEIKVENSDRIEKGHQEIEMKRRKK